LLIIKLKIYRDIKLFRMEIIIKWVKFNKINIFAGLFISQLYFINIKYKFYFFAVYK